MKRQTLLMTACSGLLLLGATAVVHAQPNRTTPRNGAAAQVGQGAPTLPPPARLGIPHPPEKDADPRNKAMAAEMRRAYQAAAAFSPDGTLASGGWDGVVRLWNLAARTEARSFQPKSKVMSLAFAPDGKTLAVGCWDGNVVLLDPATGKERLKFRASITHINVIAFAPTGRQLATGVWSHQVNVNLWDPATGKELSNLTGHDNKIWTLRFTADGKTLVSSGGDGSIRIWDVATGTEKRQFGERALGSVYAAVLAPDGKSLLACYRGKNGLICHYDVETGKRRAVCKGHQGDVYSLLLVDDGKTLISAGSDQTVRIWDLATEKESLVLKGHQHNLDLALSPDGKLLASAGEDNTVWLWDVASLGLRPNAARR